MQHNNIKGEPTRLARFSARPTISAETLEYGGVSVAHDRGSGLVADPRERCLRSTLIGPAHGSTIISVRSHRVWGALLALSLVAGTGCDAPDSDNTVATTTPVSTEAPADLQDLILSDGVVTTAEIEQARRVAGQCIRAAGFDASFERNVFGQYQITIDIPRRG